MNDVFFIVVLMYVLSWTMIKHGTWKKMTGVSDFLGWFIACTFALILVRFPIYLFVYGFTFPFNPTPTLEIISGISAILFWGSMAYWRIPMRLLGRKP